MDIHEMIAQLREFKAKSQAGGGPERVAKQHEGGKHTARERIDKLFDPGTFYEMDALALHRCRDFGMEKNRILGDGVVTGYGKVNAPFDASRLKEVALKLRELYPTIDPPGLEARATAEFIDRLVGEVTRGFKGDVGVVPRQFLRQLVSVFDIVGENPGFDPAAMFKFEPKEPNEHEQRKLTGQPPFDPEPEDDKGYPATSVEF